MKRTRIRGLLIGLTILALAAGVAAGLLASRLPVTGAKAPVDSGGADTLPPLSPVRTALVEELQLTPQQRDQMRAIWEDVREKVHQSFDDAQQLLKDRDNAVAAMLSDEQKVQFEKISSEYAARYEQLALARDRMFEDAVEKTRKLLDERQRRRYDEILRTRVPPGSLGGASVPSPSIVFPADPTTAPTTEPGESN